MSVVPLAEGYLEGGRCQFGRIWEDFQAEASERGGEEGGEGGLQMPLGL